jgi:hypothetical protein
MDPEIAVGVVAVAGSGAVTGPGVDRGVGLLSSNAERTVIGEALQLASASRGGGVATGVALKLLNSNREAKKPRPRTEHLDIF